MNMQKEKHLITCPEIFITSHITFPNGNRVCMIEVKGVFTVKSQPLPYCLSHFSDAKLNFFLKNPRKLKIGNEKKKLCASCIHKLFVVATYKINTVLEKRFVNVIYWCTFPHAGVVYFPFAALDAEDSLKPPRELTSLLHA